MIITVQCVLRLYCTVQYIYDVNGEHLPLYKNEYNDSMCFTFVLYSGRINYNAVLNYNASMDFRRFAYGKLKNSIFFLNIINIQVIPRTCTKI